VVDQTRPPDDIIVVDDGSTDDVAAALERFGERVRLVRIAHCGPGTALNTGVAEVRTEFVTFLDADDVYEPTYLAEVSRMAESRPDLDLIAVDSIFETADGPSGRFYEVNTFPQGDQRTAILRSCFVLMFTAVRVTRLRAVGGFDESLARAKDWDMWIRLILDGARAGLVDKPLARYRLHPHQLSANRVLSLEARVTVLEKTLAHAALSDDERAEAQRALHIARTRAAVTAVLASPSRRGWFTLARDGRLSRGARGFGVIGAVSPSLAARQARLRW
jgi:hypothetical protein